MKRRSFFGLLTGGVAAAVTMPHKLVGKILAPSKGFLESIGRPFTTYVVGSDSLFRFDKELIASLKADRTIFEDMSQRRAIPMHQGIQRQFFTYKA